MTSYFVIVGHEDNPLFEMDLSRVQEGGGGGSNESRRHLNQFVAHASLDLVDESKWQSGSLYLKTVDRFNELIVTAFVTASQMRFLLVHDSSVRGQESIRAFFTDVYELFIKAILNPFYVPNTYIVSSNFRKKVQIVAKKHGEANQNVVSWTRRSPIAKICTQSPLGEGNVVLVKIIKKSPPYLDNSINTSMKVGFTDVVDPQSAVGVDGLRDYCQNDYNFKNLPEGQTLGFMRLGKMLHIFVGQILRDKVPVSLTSEKLCGVIAFSGCFKSIALSMESYKNVTRYFSKKTMYLPPNNIKLEQGTPVSLCIASDAGRLPETVSVDHSDSVWVDISESSGEDGRGGWIPFTNLIRRPREVKVHHAAFKEALAKGFIRCRIVNIVCVGPPGVGKTCLKHRLLGQPLPEKRNSTPIASPVTKITAVKGKGSWSTVDGDEITMLVAHEAKGQMDSPMASLRSDSVDSSRPKRRISRSHRSDSSPAMLSLQPLPPLDTSLTSSSQPPDSPDLVTQSVPVTLLRPGRTTSESEEQVINVMSSLKDKVPVAGADDVKEFFFFLDSGGQPQFLDLLPIFIRESFMVVIFVANLSEDLDKPASFSFYEDGTDKSNGSIKTMPQSCWEMLESTARVVSSLSHGKEEGSSEKSNSPILLIVGTHLDKIATKKLKEINRKLQDKLSSLREIRLDYKEKDGEILFPINIIAEKDKMGPEIRKRLMQLSAKMPPEMIPLSWYQYERTLNKYSNDSNTSILTVSQCVELGSHMQLCSEDVKEILEFLDSVNTVLYYQNFGIVITDPQLVLGMLTSLLKITFSDSELALPPNSAKKLMESGLFSIEVFKMCLGNYSHHFIPIFQPHDLLRLLVDLLVIAETTQGYFIPSALPICTDQIKVSKYTGHFDCLLLLPVKGVVLQGVFTALVTHLLKQGDSTFTLPKPETEAEDRQQYRNAVTLSYKNGGCILLVDRFQWLELYYSASSTREAFKIKSCIMDRLCCLALSQVLPYLTGDIRFDCGFVCNLKHGGDKELPCHPARVSMDTVSHSSFHLTCTKQPTVSSNSESRRQLPWLFSLDRCNAPEIHNCMTQVGCKLGDEDFHLFGIELGVDSTTLGNMQAEYPSVPGRYAHLFDYWEKKQCSSQTWETITNALATIGRKDIHDSLMKWLKDEGQLNLTCM